MILVKAAQPTKNQFLHQFILKRIESLLTQGKNRANVDVTDSQGNTALHWTAINSNRKLMRFLESHNATRNIINNDGKTYNILIKMTWKEIYSLYWSEFRRDRLDLLLLWSFFSTLPPLYFLLCR